jgi:hypothetical protein
MTLRREHRGRFTLTTIGIVLLLLASLLVGSALADPDHKQFAPGATGSIGAGSVDPAFSVTIENRAPNQSLGSANVPLPAGLTLTPANIFPTPVTPQGTATFVDGVIQLRDLGLAPGDTAMVTLSVQADCRQQAPYVWSGIQVKQSNNFLGTGNDFAQTGDDPVTTVTGGCTLVFDDQPAHAARNAEISSEDFTPPADSGAPITVAVLGADGTSRVTSWTEDVTLSIVAGTGAPGAILTQGVATPVGGVATFGAGDAPIIDTSGTGYRLRATSTSGGITLESDPSNSFSIVDSAVTCAGGACSASSSSNTTLANVSVDNVTGILIVNVGDPDAAFSAACGDLGHQANSDDLAFDLLDAADVNSEVFRVEMTLLNATRPASRYDVCWASDTFFTQKGGSPSAEVNLITDALGNETTFFVGILGDCRGNSKRVTEPCVVGRSHDRKAGTVTITVAAPVTDPRMRI